MPADHSQVDWIWLQLLDLANHLNDSNARTHKLPCRRGSTHLAGSAVCVSGNSSTDRNECRSYGRGAIS